MQCIRGITANIEPNLPNTLALLPNVSKMAGLVQAAQTLQQPRRQEAGHDGKIAT